MKPFVKSLKKEITDAQLEHQGGCVVNYCSWGRLKPFLREASGCADDEDVKGVRVTEDGLSIFIERK